MDKEISHSQHRSVVTVGLITYSLYAFIYVCVASLYAACQENLACHFGHACYKFFGHVKQLRTTPDFMAVEARSRFGTVYYRK